jgi:hypothetical protein
MIITQPFDTEDEPEVERHIWGLSDYEGCATNMRVSDML